MSTQPTVADLIRDLKTYPLDAIVTSATVRVRVGVRYSTFKIVKAPVQ